MLALWRGRLMQQIVFPLLSFHVSLFILFSPRHMLFPTYLFRPFPSFAALHSLKIHTVKTHSSFSGCVWLLLAEYHLVRLNLQPATAPSVHWDAVWEWIVCVHLCVCE